MSRLYLRADTDARKTQLTARAHEYASVRLYWGDSGASKLAAELEVRWAKEADAPAVWFSPGPGVALCGQLRGVLEAALRRLRSLDPEKAEDKADPLRRDLIALLA